MVTIRRWYMYLVCAVSLQAVVWAVINLLYTLLSSTGDRASSLAFQIAVIASGGPVYVGHWLWAQSLAQQSSEERQADLRQFYLYAMLAAFLAPGLVWAFDFTTALADAVVGVDRYTYLEAAARANMVRDAYVWDGVALVLLAIAWTYHFLTARRDAAAAAAEIAPSLSRRLYVLGFSGAGLLLTLLAAQGLLGAALGLPISATKTALAYQIASLLVGLPLWLVFWRWAQQLFGGAAPYPADRESTLRKFYLYVFIIGPLLSVLTNLAFIVAGAFRRLFDLPPQGDIREPIAVISVFAVAWLYHSRLLQRDMVVTTEGPQQATLRRLYWYLMAAVGLSVFVIGVGGDLSVLIRALGGQAFNFDLREQTAWFTSAVIVGLPVWLWPWWAAQHGALALTPAGADERRSLMRKLYLYLSLFIATMVALGCAIYTLWMILQLLLGAPRNTPLLVDVGQTLAYALIAVGVWLYHGWAVQQDGRLNHHDRAARMQTMRLLLVTVGESELNTEILSRLTRELAAKEFSGVTLTPLNLPAPAPITAIADSNLIVGPWTMLVPSDTVPLEFVQAINASAARKILIPAATTGWEWAGVDRWSHAALAKQTVQAVRQVLEGEPVTASRPIGILGAFGILGVGVVVLAVVFSLINLIALATGGF